jgi:hypothetical protein
MWVAGMIPVVADPALIRKHVADFTEQGYVHFTGVYTPAQVEKFHELHERAVADWQFANGTDEHPDAVAGLLERFPREIFLAVAHPLLLGFAEAVMGHSSSSTARCSTATRRPARPTCQVAPRPVRIGTARHPPATGQHRLPGLPPTDDGGGRAAARKCR